MNSSKDQFLGKLEKLRIEYISDFPKRIQSLAKTWHSYDEGNQEEVRQILLRQAHSLKGSGATYGFAKVSKLASQLYNIINDLQAPDNLPGDNEKEQISLLLDQLKHTNLDDEFKFEPLPIGPVDNPERLHENVTLLLVMANKNDASDLIQQLQHYGYNISVINSSDTLEDNVKSLNPFAIVTDTLLQSPQASDNKEADQENLVPIIYLSDSDDIRTRLQAVRMRCTHFLIKPVQTPDLVEMLDTINHKRHEEPNRIMIIDDTKSLAFFYEATLQSKGMNTCIVNDPMLALEQLVIFNPELILMDMYMPGCSGQELAAVIRQHEAYVSIPIVYLSSELDTKKQLIALGQGGDDFLTKPIKPEHLIRAVEARTARYRNLRALMVRDSLTGLYNHTKTKELLEQDLYRCARNNTNLVFAMLDIDKFKTVNDTYGHPVGDKVIKSLARILKQRLRKSDTIGRYGGEEFAIVLYDTDINNALKVVNEIREHFSQLSHNSGDIEFNVTFSCGLAAYPYFDTAAELNEAADKALYQAKESGRNRVVVAELTVE